MVKVVRCSLWHHWHQATWWWF